MTPFRQSLHSKVVSRQPTVSIVSPPRSAIQYRPLPGSVKTAATPRLRISGSSPSSSDSWAIRSWKSTIAAASPGSPGRIDSSPSAKRGLVAESLQQVCLGLGGERLFRELPQGPHRGRDLAEEPPALRASGKVLVDPAGPVEAQPAVEVLA